MEKNLFTSESVSYNDAKNGNTNPLLSVEFPQLSIPLPSAVQAARRADLISANTLSELLMVSL